MVRNLPARSGDGEMAGCIEDGDESPGSIKFWEVPDQLRHFQFLGKDCASVIIVRGTNCRFTPRPIYLLRKSTWYSLDRNLGGTQNSSGRHGEEKHIALTGTRTLAVQLFIWSLYLLGYPGSSLHNDSKSYPRNRPWKSIEL
jgi:hypothetical protein